jgi:hypothetical protein
VSGSIGPLIEALAAHPVVALTSREPSLEEIFLHHYDESDGRQAAQAGSGLHHEAGARGDGG